MSGVLDFLLVEFPEMQSVRGTFNLVFVSTHMCNKLSISGVKKGGGSVERVLLLNSPKIFDSGFIFSL